ncbi:hypothetical protein A8B78_05735 [Jannaschia sp. EhC01]|nr:hypothetical protein A8B78_05735 [Jannaschia sp. EhC01]
MVGGAILMSAPQLAFAHSAGDGRIMFHATRPLSQEAALRAGAEAWAEMQDTPFGPPDHQINVYVTGGAGWRHQVFFRPATWAGGITYPILSTSTIFLRDVDLEAGRLVGSEGPIPDPRDLTYYLVHEMTHLRHGETVGPIAFLRTPHWVREGIPDIGALGSADTDLMAAAMAGEVLQRDTFGSYPVERVCATMVLAQPGMDMARLLRLDAPMRDPRSCMTLPALVVE